MNVAEIKSRYYSRCSNERVSCDELPDLNVQPWAESPPPDVVPPGYSDAKPCSPTRGEPLGQRFE